MPSESHAQSPAFDTAVTGTTAMTTPTTRRTRIAFIRRFAAASAVALAIGPATACGGDAKSAEVATVNGGASGASAATAADESARAREFARCMRDNGVPMQDPDPGTGKLDIGDMRGSADATTLRKAMDACRDKAPQSFKERNGPSEKQLDAMRAFAKCMRENGIAIEDPGPDGFEKGSFATSAPGFAQAWKKCQETAPLRPEGAE
ncbi:MAG TPA: hypothetical protein VLH10_20935 [Yinghuangia sp.]|nr:hypothetical protein [Yinghuangia sp.]